MKVPVIIFALLAFGSIAFAQEPSGTVFKLVLSDHPGQLTWGADGFKIVQSSAKPNGRELGIRGQDSWGRLSFLGFLFLMPEGAPLTSAKCRDGALDLEKKGNPSLTILRTSEISRSPGLPLSLATYTTKTRDGSVGYLVRGFVATSDICGDLEFYSKKPISADDADLVRVFSSYQLDPTYAPKFADVVFYAQVLYQTKMYQAAGPAFEKALALLPEDGSPFPSARVARRVVTDQAGMAYGVSGDLRKARAVFEAAAEVQKAGIKVKPEVMIPLVGFKRELDLQVAVVHAAAKAVMAEKKVKLTYMVGTMIEIPRGALTADEIAQTAEFFSFGTNDLTQTCLGMSRDDSGSFLPPYAELEIIKTNPFASIDQAGVGQLMKIAVEKGNKGRPGIKLGICGEHGGDPNSVKFCHKLGLNYVSCSPFRVPVARLAAAQAALEDEAAKPANKPTKKK